MPYSQPIKNYGSTMLKQALLLCVLCVSTSFAQSATVLVLGDSISAGYGIDPAKGWVKLLEQQWSQEAAVINASISGETSAGGLARLPKLLKEYAPTLVVIELGGNDGLRGYPIPSLKDNLTAMVTLSQAANAQVLLLGMQIPPNYGKRYSRMFSDSYSAVAQQNNIVLMPFFLQDIAVNPDLMQSDGIHPSQTAQALLLENATPYLQQAIESQQ
jgi:acyl-CoA thioesterase-1